MSEDRISRRRLEELLRAISDSDRSILHSVRQYKYLTTGQIRRLYFTDCASDRSALRTTSRVLARLRQVGLIAPLARRIGGVRAGSGAYVWALASAGARLLAMSEKSEDSARKRVHEPSPAFLEHTLAVAEVCIYLIELSRGGKIQLVSYELEPDCWRQYTNTGGTASNLRPDLFTVTSAGEYEDYWFMEIDLATESPSTVLRKCGQYLAYMQSGIEQAKSGVFPLVIWIVPDGKRKGSLQRHIADNFKANARLFIVLTLDELEPLVLSGAEAFLGEKPLKTQGNFGISVTC